MEIKILLNLLADSKCSATVKDASFGWAMLLRYTPFINAIYDEMGGNQEKFNQWLAGGNCYVFEIGKNCGDVFSANMVEKIEMTKDGAIIHLK